MNRKFNIEILKYIFEMYKNIDVAIIKVECIIRYPHMVYSPFTHDIEWAFLNRIAELDYEDLTDEMRIDILKEVAVDCSDGKINKNNNKNRAYAESVFITFVRMFNSAAEHIMDYEDWPAERIARTALDYMYRYYSEYWESGKSEEEYFLGCLLTTVGNDRYPG